MDQLAKVFELLKPRMDEKHTDMPSSSKIPNAFFQLPPLKYLELPGEEDSVSLVR